MRRILPLFLYLLSSIYTLPLSTDPQCTDLPMLQGEMHSRSDGGKFSLNRTTSSIMGLHQSTCLEIQMSNSSSILHSLTFIRIEQLHPIISSYRFAYPKVTTKCICNCEGSDYICNQDDYHLRNCSSGTVCYRTYHPSQSSNGCSLGGQSQVCCQIRIDPYKEHTYTALKIGQPDTNVVMKYRQYEKKDQERWTLTYEKSLTLPLNKGPSRVEVGGNNRLDISLSGSGPSKIIPSNELYFIRDGTTELRGGIPLNDIGESSIEKLGWLRQDSYGIWTVPNGLLKITQAHRLKVENCIEQRYVTGLIAEQFVLETDDNKEKKHISYGHSLTELVWIESAVYEDKLVRVRHSEGTSIEIRVSSQKRPTTLINSSILGWFDGEITVDRLSQHILNITFFESVGGVVGNIYSSEAKERTDLTLATTINSGIHHMAASIDSSVNSRRYVCFHPMGDSKAEKCKWLGFKEVPIASPPPSIDLLAHTGECPSCNKAGPAAFLEYADPRNWFNGKMNFKLLAVGVFEIVMICVLLIISIMIITKCIIPLIRCSLYIPKPLKK